MGKIHPGKAWPLGSTITKRGVNFSIASPNATKVELVLYESRSNLNIKEIFSLNANNKSGDYWHIEVEGIGAGTCYAYKAFGARDDGFQSEKILLDPCAREIVGWDSYKRKAATTQTQNNAESLKGVVCERKIFDFNSHPRPNHSWESTVIYELHIGGFTNSPCRDVEEKLRGTFLGLIPKIPYLKEIGITTIELLPVFAFDSSDGPFGLENYWGYSPVNWLTPHESYFVKDHPLSARDQVRKLVSACHDEGIEVILDVVYNHTTEGGKHGPCISWRGLGESLYYHKNKKGGFLDVTGCGNTVAANRPIVRKLILESIKCWAIELGIDGFRFDLGISLSRGENLEPLSAPPLFEDIEADPDLCDLKLISEPWDCGGLYKLGDFPASRVRTWNGYFRDDLRRFWQGGNNTTWNLKERLNGNRDLYKQKELTELSINFITSHDGFTLYDLVSFSKKHNFSNGENNQDGENHNNSWSNGVEGPSTNHSIIELRMKHQRNLLTSLLLSPGIPMLLMGDEIGRSQGGNNNIWCQNNSLGSMLWDKTKCDLSLLNFVKSLLRIRRSFPELFSSQRTSKLDSKKLSIQWHGVKLNEPDWGHWSHTISYSINQENSGAIMWMGLNAYEKKRIFELPPPISEWVKVVNTSQVLEKGILKENYPSNKQNIELEDRSTTVLLSSNYASQLNL